MEVFERMYVNVVAEHNEAGEVRPREITLPDGRRFDVDRLIDVRQAHALKAGGQGIRYTVRIAGKERYLFDDEGRWFVEAKKHN